MEPWVELIIVQTGGKPFNVVIPAVGSRHVGTDGVVQGGEPLKICLAGRDDAPMGRSPTGPDAQ